MINVWFIILLSIYKQNNLYLGIQVRKIRYLKRLMIIIYLGKDRMSISLYE